MMAGYSLLSLTGYAILMWGFEFLARIHGMNPISTGQLMGVVIGVGGSVGALIGGRLVDKMSVIKVSRTVSVPAMITLAGLPVGALFLLSQTQTMAAWLFLPFFLMLNIYIPAMFSANQNLARLDMRATASAIMLFIVNIVGAGAGPLLVGALSDVFAAEHGIQSIRYALLCAVGLGVIGALLLLYCTRFLEEDLKLSLIHI